MVKTAFIDTDEITNIFGEIERKEKIETIVDLAKDFVKKREELSRLKNEADLDSFTLISHSLKSNCRYIGAEQLSTCSLKLEKVHSFEDDAFPNLWDQFLITHRQTMDDIKQALRDI